MRKLLSQFRNYRIYLLSLFVLFGTVNVLSAQSLVLNQAQNNSLPYLQDGPHIEYLSDTKVRLNYYVYDSENDFLKLKRKRRRLKGGIEIRGAFGDVGTYFLLEKFNVPDDSFSNVEKFMVVGDIHGEYDKLIAFLKNSKVIDDSLKWNYGNGHLVFLGDVFDRGNKVTECLLFIKNLQYYATISGGMVHIILGNHEFMNLEGDYRYLNENYYKLLECKKLSYDELYATNMELGRWIRSWPAMIKINDVLCVHAGISMKFLEKKYEISAFNTMIYKYLNGFPQDTDDINFTHSVYGPFWYRGYLKDSREYARIKALETDNILDYFNVEHIVFGHTENTSFQILFDKKLIGIDVPFRFQGKTEQAVEFVKSDIFKIYSNGNRELLD